MAEAAENLAELPRLGARRSFSDAVRLIAERWRLLFLIGVALAAATALLRLAADRFGVWDGEVGFGGDYFNYELGVALVTAAFTALILRVLIVDGPGRFDQGLGAGVYVLLAILASLVPTMWVAAVESLGSRGGAWAPAAFFGGAAGMLVIVYIFTKLLLWPLGRLMERTDITPSRSWALMHRASWSYMVALTLAFGPFLVLYIGLWAAAGGAMSDAPPLLLVLEHAVTAAWTILACAITAAVYRARIGSAPAS